LDSTVAAVVLLTQCEDRVSDDSREDRQGYELHGSHTDTSASESVDILLRAQQVFRPVYVARSDSHRHLILVVVAEAPVGQGLSTDSVAAERVPLGIETLTGAVGLAVCLVGEPFRNSRVARDLALARRAFMTVL